MNRSSLDLVLVGAPGSGKGTRAERICEQLQLPHIATGDLFRDNLKRDTDLGKAAKAYMDRGELVPDDVTDAMVRDRLLRPDAGVGFVLDGYPRTFSQAQTLGGILTKLGRNLAGVLFVVVTDEAIVKRLGGRRTCRQCQASYHVEHKPSVKPGVCDHCGGELYQRADDNPETVNARLRTFHAQTEPVIEFYRKAGLVIEIPGDGEVATAVGVAVDAARKIQERFKSG